MSLTYLQNHHRVEGNKPSLDPDVLLEEMVEQEAETARRSKLVVYNDDHNTFEWVIECFIEVCRHTQEQAEQLSLIIHFKGKAIVKEGNFSQLKPMHDALIDRGLSSVIEED